MQRNFPMHKKFATLQGWPKRLDQELRTQFGDTLAPHTYFDKENMMYKTDYAGGTESCGSPEQGVLVDPLVEQFIAGFMSAVNMVVGDGS